MKKININIYIHLYTVIWKYYLCFYLKFKFNQASCILFGNHMCIWSWHWRGSRWAGCLFVYSFWSEGVSRPYARERSDLPTQASHHCCSQPGGHQEHIQTWYFVLMTNTHVELGLFPSPSWMFPRRYFPAFIWAPLEVFKRYFIKDKKGILKIDKGLNFMRTYCIAQGTLLSIL